MSTQATGHVKNVANLDRFNLILAAMGTTYNPANAAISITQLKILQAAAGGYMDDLNTAHTEWKNRTNDREAAFQDLKKLCTRIYAALLSSGASQPSCMDKKELIDAIASSAKLTKADAGRTSDPAGNNGNSTPGGTPPPVSDPVPTHKRHIGFDEKINLFERLIVSLESEPLYIPHEQDLAIASLTAKLGSMKSTNNGVITTEITLRTARNTRDNVLYKSGTGVLDLIKQAKAYIKSISGPKNPIYKSVQAIKFVRVVPVKSIV